MAIRTATEIIGSVRTLLGDQTPEGMAELLEDITDSITAPDMSGYVSKEEYDRAMTERNDFERKANDYRDRYINRFYQGYDNPNSKGYIDSSVSQEMVERDEKDVSYDDLFE